MDARKLLRFIELDRYRGGECTGDYLSRLHYLEDWLDDNDRRGLVDDLTRNLGGVSVSHSAREMSVGWRHYRYLEANRRLLRPLGQMEARVSSHPLYMIPNSRVAGIESKFRDGDIIGIVSRDRTVCIPPRMSGSLCGRMMDCISCTHPRRTITAALSSIRDSRVICIAIAPTREFWWRDR